MHTNKYICSYPNCGLSFKNQRGVLIHERRDPGHNPSMLINRFSNGGGNKRHQIPYEYSKDVERNIPKKIATGPQFVDVDILNSMINCNNSNVDENYFGYISDDDDDEGDETNIGMTEILHNIILQEDLNLGDIQHPCHPDLRSKYILAYRHYQTNLYKQIFGINALESLDIQQFKRCLEDFEPKRFDTLKCYLFAKSCNMSRANGDELLQLIRHFSPSSDLCLPKAWKSVTRAISEQTKFYNCHMETIPFPSHWEMDKWDTKNGSCPEKVVIRVRDPLELIADQCVNPIIHFLWKDYVHIDCYSKTNNRNEKVFCDIMSSEWARKTLEEIREIDPNGLLLPLLFYADGVSIGMNGKANVTPVMMTLGWYSEELFKQDISKMVIGYIDKLSDISDEILIKHLHEVKRFSRTKCEENIKYFKKQVFFKFWEVTLHSIKTAATRGILVKIIGHEEPKILFPRIAFHAGDDPAQHEVAAIKCGSNVRHNCIRCMYNSKECGQYNPEVDNFRDMTIIQQIQDGEKTFLKYLKGERYTSEESNSLKDLQVKGYHPICNPFFNAPFGYDNHIYKSPTDIMHLFACGLIKSVLQWTLIIICEIRSHSAVDKSNPFSNNTGLFDKRLREFPTVPKVPHVEWCKFKDGLIYIAQSKSTLEKSYATGSGGGFRSSEYIPALIQSFFAIGDMGDILPNQNAFRFNKRVVGSKLQKEPVELGNVSKKVQNAIMSVLDMYFACKCNEFTENQIQLLDNMGTRMIAHTKVLWNLKQAIMYEAPRETLMRKMHAPEHIPQYISELGPPLYADTAVYESSHKHYTTSVWRGTSKRLGTLVKEMTTASVIQSHSEHLDFYSTLKQMDGISKCQEKFGPPPSKDFTINAFENICDVRFIITSEKDREGFNILKGCGLNKHIFDDDVKYSLFGHSSLPSKKHLCQHLRKRYFNHENQVWNQMISANTMFEFSIVRAATTEGSKESGVGKGVIYAMSKNAGRNKRYDYVTVKVIEEIDGEEVEVDQVAQVLMMLQVHKFKMNNENKRVLKQSVWLLIVQYMKESSHYTNNQHEHLKKLQWERVGKSNSFSIDMITMDCLVGSATVIPCFSFHEKIKGIIKKYGTPIMGSPVLSDIFWSLDRKFFDRSGWEELVIENRDSSRSSITEINRDNMQSFINNNFIQPALSNEETKVDFEELYAEEEDISKVISEEEGDY